MATWGINDLERGGDETFDFLCVVCKGKNKNMEAEMFCSECHDYYCASCVKCHEVIPALKNHQILDKSTAPLPAVPTERCKEHRDKPVDMYCKNHNVVGCSTCMLDKHSSCEDKHYIPDFVKDNPKATNTNFVEEQLERLAKSLNEFQEAFIKEKEDLKGNKDQVLEEIGTFRHNINKLLDQFENSVVQKLEQRIKSLTDKFDSSLNELQATLPEIKGAQDCLKSAGGNMPQMFVSIMKANQVVACAEEKVKINESQVLPTEIYFLANRKLRKLFSEIQGLGSIRMKEKLRITGRQKYPVNLKSDKQTCNIACACTLNDGTIILADYNNSKLKRLNSFSYTVEGCCDVPEWPSQVCAITDTEVAVTCSCVYTKLIQFVTVRKAMKKTRQIKTGFYCKGLAYADEKLFVSDDISVYVFSLFGEQLQQLNIDQSGQELLSAIWALAVNSDKSWIYVANLYKGLIILDMNGELVGQYNGDKLSGACGICIDNNGNVLVCGRDSRNALQFSPDGKLIGEILKTDRLCGTVCCNTNNSEMIKMIVGCLDENEIEVYNVSAE